MTLSKTNPLNPTASCLYWEDVPAPDYLMTIISSLEQLSSLTLLISPVSCEL